MTKEELEKEAEEYLINHGYGDEVRMSEWIDIYLAGAEPREKRIAELEDKLANADYQLEGRDNEIRELKNAIEGYKNQIFYKEKALAKVKKEKDRIVHRVTKDKKRLIRRNIEFKAQIEKMKCCSNCVYLAGCDLSGYEECKNFDKWELREIKENE